MLQVGASSIGWLNLCVWLVRSTGRGERGKEAHLGARRWGRRAGHWSKGGGADLAGAGVPVAPSAGLALGKPPALGSQFLLSTGRKMKEVPGWSGRAEPWRAPNLSHLFADERTKGQRSCVGELPGFETRSVE